MTLAVVGVGTIVAVFVICIVWATEGKPLSDQPHHDEIK